jgi:hypothetical protein
MKGKGWITGAALELALKAGVKGVKKGDQIYCSYCGAAHDVAGWMDDDTLVFDVIGPQNLNRNNFNHIVGWRPRVQEEK